MSPHIDDLPSNSGGAFGQPEYPYLIPTFVSGLARESSESCRIGIMMALGKGAPYTFGRSAEQTHQNIQQEIFSTGSMTTSRLPSFLMIWFVQKADHRI